MTFETRRCDVRSMSVAGEPQRAARRRRGVGLAHRHRRDAVQQHQDVVREGIVETTVQARRLSCGGCQTTVDRQRNDPID